MQRVPAQIGPYVISSELGRGGMGIVYLAHDSRLDRHVAIKSLPEEFIAHPDQLARFQREARTLASLNHANIGSIHGLEEIDGKAYLVLEYVKGETLQQRLQRGAIAVEEALPIALQIAAAVEAAHERGIVHRDLKPANIKFSDTNRVKVLDFGLSKAMDEKPPAISDAADTISRSPGQSPTLPGMVLGTAGYLSPEQARGKPVDKRTDIFAFGCVLFEMLSGTMAFGGETV